MAKPPTKQGVSRRQYAKTRNVSEAAIRKHIATGVLASAVMADGRLDPDAADKLLAASIMRGPKEPVQVSAAKARRQRAQVRLLHDEMMDLRRSVIGTKDAKRLVTEDYTDIKQWLRSIPEKAATAAAGLPSEAAHRALRDCVNQALTDSHQVLSERVPPDLAPKPQPDIDNMTPVELTALQLNLQAEKLEYERALKRGIARWIRDAVVEFEEKLSVTKGILLAIPARVAVFMESSSIPEARRRIGEEIERAVAVLDHDADEDINP